MAHAWLMESQLAVSMMTAISTTTTTTAATARATATCTATATARATATPPATAAATTPPTTTTAATTTTTTATSTTSSTCNVLLIMIAMPLPLPFHPPRCLLFCMLTILLLFCFFLSCFLLFVCFLSLMLLFLVLCFLPLCPAACYLHVNVLLCFGHAFFVFGLNADSDSDPRCIHLRDCSDSLCVREPAPYSTWDTNGSPIPCHTTARIIYHPNLSEPTGLTPATTRTPSQKMDPNVHVNRRTLHSGSKAQDKWNSRNHVIVHVCYVYLIP